MESDKVLHFDRFTLNPSRGCLQADGRNLKLRPKSFDVLRYFAENPGRLISKDEITSAVWPNVVVTDDSLVQCISDVRSVLEDDGQRFIRTIPRRGYMFVADVDAAARRAQHGRQTRGMRAIGWSLVLILIAAVAAWAIERLRGSPDLRGGLTIAVLPFVNHDASNDRHFSDGLAEDIVTAVSRFRDVTVIAPNSSFRYREGTDISKAGRELGAAFVVVGSVGRDQDRVRVSVQLVDVRSGATRWAERYDRSLRSLFELQDELAAEVVSKLVGHARHLAAERISTRQPRTFEAYELVLKARQGFNAFKLQSFNEALALLQRAIALDPEYAPAWELRARVLLRLYVAPFDDRHLSPPVLEHAREAALKALSLDPNLSSAHDALGFSQLLQQQYDASVATLRHAIALNPNEPGAFRSYGNALGAIGEHRASIEAFEQARRLDPFSPPVVLALMARAHNMLGEHGKALQLARECGERGPDVPVCFLMRAIAAAKLGQPDEAQIALRHLLKIDPKASIRRVSQPKRFKLDSDQALWVDQLRAAGIPE